MSDYEEYCNPGTPMHLGGHRNTTNVDERLLAWMKSSYGIRSMLDLGCGPGGMLDVAERLGIESLGVDGDPTIVRKGIVLHDFTTGPLRSIRRRFDLVWCVEVVEHIEEKFIGNLICAFHLGNMVLMTHAPPGIGGWHHVNCQTEGYWISTMESAGFRLSSENHLIRANAAPGLHAALHGLLFMK